MTADEAVDLPDSPATATPDDDRRSATTRDSYFLFGTEAVGDDSGRLPTTQ